jgi:hypothetical protein
MEFFYLLRLVNLYKVHLYERALELAMSWYFADPDNEHFEDRYMAVIRFIGMNSHFADAFDTYLGVDDELEREFKAAMEAGQLDQIVP